MKSNKNKRWMVIYSAMVIVFITFYYVIDLEFFDPWDEYIPIVKELFLSLSAISLIFLLSKIISEVIYRHNHIEGDRYNLLRIVRFLTISLNFIIITSFLFQSLYAAAVSFGLISLILGFALQAPIASFIAWIYLVFRRSYLVGDRIQIKNFRGDVVEISYLDTSILECYGDYLGNDQRSGRIIRFPNSLILREEIVNYSGPDIPFIWNETALQVAFTSDLQFVETTLLEAANKDFKEFYKNYENKIENEKESRVYFRVNTFAWLEAVVTYPVNPKDTSARRNRILKYALAILNKSPEKVKFPEGTLR